jgi:hypothetical protein
VKKEVLIVYAPGNANACEGGPALGGHAVLCCSSRVAPIQCLPLQRARPYLNACVTQGSAFSAASIRDWDTIPSYTGP